jgi:hypothetical protein
MVKVRRRRSRIAAPTLYRGKADKRVTNWGGADCNASAELRA